jgi:hypothetical protein
MPNPPAVFHLHNRTAILVLSPPVLLFCSALALARVRAGQPWPIWLAALVVWICLLGLALRRRLVLTDEGLEYTESFSTIRIPWAHVSRLESKRILGVWSIEGLVAWEDTPRLRDVFINLTQFDKAWRQGALAFALQKRRPSLFSESNPPIGGA